MKVFSIFIFIAIGIIISATLITYTTISAQNLLIAGAVIFAVSVVLSYLSHRANTVTPKQKPVKKTTKKKVKVPKGNKSVNGTVKWFNKTKGFGFITQENGDDIFVHQSSLAFKNGTLKDGQSVTMNVIMDDKGPQAENVQRA